MDKPLEQQISEGFLTEPVFKEMYSWPSTVGNCRRELAYAYHGFSALPLNYKQAKVFIEGSGIHKALTTKLLRTGALKYREVPKFYFDPGSGVKMSIKLDGVVQYYNNEMVFEAKSASLNSFTRMMMTEKISHKYYLQIQLYMAATNLDLAMVFLWNKDYDEKGEGYKSKLLGKLIIPRDTAAIEEVKERQNTVLKSTIDNLPPRDFLPKPNGELEYECNDCRFRHHCYPEKFPNLKK